MGKRIITEDNVEGLARNGLVEVVRGMIVTPLAREHASRLGIRLVYAGGTVPGAEDIPRDPTTGRKGFDPDVSLKDNVAAEVARAIAEVESRAASIPTHSPLAREDTGRVLAAASAGEPVRAVVVATGLNHPGIAAALTSSISECDADIQDISQTIVSDFFSMIFVVDLTRLSCGLTFKGFKEKVEAAGKAVGAEVVVFHEDILRAMHRV